MVDMSPEQATYSIGVAARMTGISVHTLRMWERRYELLSSRRTRGGQRAYTLADIDHLKLLRALTKKGVRIGDIAKLPVNQLMNLLLENGEVKAAEVRDRYHIVVIGEKNLSLCSSLKNRFPQCTFSLWRENPRAASALVAEDLLNFDVDAQAPEGHLPVLLFNSPTVQPILIEALLQLESKWRHLVIGSDYVHPTVRAAAKRTNIQFFEPSDPESLSIALREVVVRTSAADKVEATEQSAMTQGLPPFHPKLFTEDQLTRIEQQRSLLDCECPPHIVELIQKLSAFEQYSKGCEVESESQAFIHACIYNYAAHARHLMEKALVAVASEHEGQS